MGSHPDNPKYPSDNDGWQKTSCISQWDTGNKTFCIISETADLRHRCTCLSDHVPIETLEAIYREVSFVEECSFIHTYKRTQPVAMLSDLSLLIFLRINPLLTA